MVYSLALRGLLGQRTQRLFAAGDGSFCIGLTWRVVESIVFQEYLEWKRRGNSLMPELNRSVNVARV